MSLKQPTPRAYLALGLINAAIAVALALRQSWTAAYFLLLAGGAFWGALRARSSRRSAP